ncbi:MAG: bifunctional UDP-N-acetylglucosamine diphosphorylase/glucosamine-1-phosphate N-acetyltransferase GlmU [Solirubrobacterales bacterium]|nr:bifunctional UDP-N-acetylglucosamine diphosphorylase/glucosamine-1-phosphate N-acetyltransferase GlmU [Solirubrobacterales bacterium]
MAAPVVVILAAGQGTRMRSETPKLLHEVCGRAIIAWPVAAARAAGAGEIVVVEGPDRPLASSLDGQVTTAVQQEPRGTADAVKSAAQHIDPGGTVIVLNGDHPLITAETLRGLAEAHARSGAAATLATAVLDDPSGYGRVVRAPDGTVERVVETKAPGDATELELHIREISTGIYAFDGAALLTALEEVQAHNAQGELYLPDVVPAIRAHERSVTAHEIADASELGVNDRAQLAAVRAIAQRRIHERHMLAGVTIVDPAATVIDVDVEIGQDAVIAPFTSLHGATQIGRGARIGPLSTLIDAQVGARATVVHSYLHGADVGEGASVGPFSFLRPGALLREGAKAGAFVEIKNSDIGVGAKVPHLSYIGDTDIGERTNIGAGSITANYDGKNKNRTHIGAGAFVGVDTMFVAPVSMGDGAYTAAGSVITDDIPDGALGIARARQRTIEGYIERRKQRDSGERKPEEKGKNPAGEPGDR